MFKTFEGDFNFTLYSLLFYFSCLNSAGQIFPNYSEE